MLAGMATSPNTVTLEWYGNLQKKHPVLLNTFKNKMSKKVALEMRTNGCIQAPDST